MMRNAAKVKLGRLYEKTSTRGTRYFVGRLGLARVLMFQSRETADDGGAIWELYLEEVEDPRPRSSQGERPAQRPARARPEPPDQDEPPFHDDPLDDVLPFERE